MSESRKRKVVVIGAGFGGLQAIKKLSRNNDLEITVIDKKKSSLIPTSSLSGGDGGFKSRGYRDPDPFLSRRKVECDRGFRRGD